MMGTMKRNNKICLYNVNIVIHPEKFTPPHTTSNTLTPDLTEASSHRGERGKNKYCFLRFQ